MRRDPNSEVTLVYDSLRGGVNYHGELQQVLLCGATGHLGRHVVKQLGAKGCFVRALVRTPHQGDELRGFVQEAAIGDLLHPGTLTAACAGIDTVISAAGASVHLNTRGSTGFREIDFMGHRNLLEQAQKAGVRKFVYVSVATTPEIACTAYVRAKEDFAALLRASGLDYHILRPTGFFSAFADLVGMARKGPLPMIGGGTGRTNPIDDEEVAAACLEGMDSNERERSVGGPDILTRKEITNLVFQVVKRAPKYRPLPVLAVRAAAGVTRLFNRRIADLAQFYLALSCTDAIAPAYGTRRLEDYLRILARYC